MYANTQTTTAQIAEQAGATRPATESVTWRVDVLWMASRRRKTVLCRETANEWVIQHVRTVTVSQRAPSRCEIDTAPALEDLPEFVRAKLPEDLQVPEVTDGA